MEQEWLHRYGTHSGVLWAMVIMSPCGSSHADIACFVVDTLAGVILNPQLPQALLATLVSTTIAAVGALLIALLVIVALWPGPKWQRMCARLPWLLAIPHVAFAPAPFCSLLTEGCFMTISHLTPPMDRFGIGLGLTLAVKESAFLLSI